MNGITISILFVLWYGISLFISEKMSDRFAPGKQWLFFISFVFSPFVGFLVLSLVKKKS